MGLVRCVPAPEIKGVVEQHPGFELPQIIIDHSREAEGGRQQARILIYHEGSVDGLPPVGEYAAGELYLGVDPFFWSETHAKRWGAPNLFYDWHVEEVLLETTPWIESLDDQGRKVRRRDEVAQSFAAVARTNAFEDDDGNAHYVLRCARL